MSGTKDTEKVDGNKPLSRLCEYMKSVTPSDTWVHLSRDINSALMTAKDEIGRKSFIEINSPVASDVVLTVDRGDEGVRYYGVTSFYAGVEVMKMLSFMTGVELEKLVQDEAEIHIGATKVNLFKFPF